MNVLNFNNLEDKMTYMSPELEVIEIELSRDVLSNSGEGPLEPTSIPTVPSEFPTDETLETIDD